MLKAISLPQGIRTINLDSVFVGPLPNFVIITFIENTAFSGVSNKNPYNFKSYDLKNLQLFKNNMPIPYEPLDYSDEEVARAYTLFLDNIDAYNNNKTIPITFDNYKAGFFIAAFNLSPLSELNDCNNIHLEGNLRISMQFAKNLPHTVTALIYGTIPDVLVINRDYNCSTRYQ